jgi:thioredoxin-related protein
MNRTAQQQVLVQFNSCPLHTSLAPGRGQRVRLPCSAKFLNAGPALRESDQPRYYQSCDDVRGDHAAEKLSAAVVSPARREFFCPPVDARDVRLGLANFASNSLHPLKRLILFLSATAALAQTPAKAPLPPETEMSHDGWFAEMPSALAEAKKTGLDLLIDFGGSDWCAPCKWLKENILTKPEFNERAVRHFVRVDIDSLARGLSPERKARYVALQKQYRIGTFPSIILATPEGEPYAWTTYIPVVESIDIRVVMAGVKQDRPETFWRQIEPLILRGKIFRAGLAKAEGLTGTAKADALTDALAEVRPDFLLWYHTAKLEELRALDPSDRRGFLAYLAGCKAYADLEDRIGGGYELNPEVKVVDVDALIGKFHLKGETLQQALAMKATLLVMQGELGAALGTIGAFAAAQNGRGPFDRGDYQPITAENLAALSRSVARGLAKPGDTVAQYRALHDIFEGQQLPNRYKISCHATGGSAFQPIIAVRKSMAEGFGRALLAATASLAGEAGGRTPAPGA